MSVDRSELLLPAHAGARVVAAKFLADAASAAPRAVGGDADALHDFRVAVRRLRSWIRAFDDMLDGAIKGKQRRRLKRIADATNPGRDLHVQLEWLGATAQHASARRQEGAAWFSKYLLAASDPATADLRAAIERDFAKTYDTLADRLSAFEADDEPPPTPTLAAAIGERIEPFALALATQLDGVRGVGDERAAHKARIRAKRLRYLLEPLSDEVAEAKALVSRLKSLQDHLGRIHDAHVMSHALRDALECAAIAAARRDGAAVLGEELVPLGDDPDPKLLAAMPRGGVLSLMRRVRAELDAAFAAAPGEWLPGGMEALAADAARLAEQLRET